MLKIAFYRKEKNVTQAKLANARSTLAMYETGKSEPDLDALEKFADYFEVSLDDLFGREKITPKECTAGLHETKQESITPLEDDLLNAFREIGKKYGVDGQKNVLTLLNIIFEVKS